MATEKIYPKGIRVFPKHEKQPSFVIGAVVISPNEFNTWLRDNQQLLTDYKGEKQLKLQLLKGEKGLYMTVDTYRKDESQQPINSGNEDQSLPF